MSESGSDTPVLRRAEWNVVPVLLTTCQRLVGDLHYAKGGANTATFTHGLVRRDEPLRVRGVAWWLPPTRSAAEASWDGPWQQVLTLSRLAIEEDVPKNAASFMLARSTKFIRSDERFRCLTTYADEGQGPNAPHDEDCGFWHGFACRCKPEMEAALHRDHCHECDFLHGNGYNRCNCQGFCICDRDEDDGCSCIGRVPVVPTPIDSGSSEGERDRR